MLWRDHRPSFEAWLRHTTCDLLRTHRLGRMTELSTLRFLYRWRPHMRQSTAAASNDSGDESESTAATARKPGKKKKKKPRPIAVCIWCEVRTAGRQCGNFHCKGDVCEEHLQHRWLQGKPSRRRYCPHCMTGPVRDSETGPLLGDML